MFFALLIGLNSGLVLGKRKCNQSLGNDILTTEALGWSWRKALKSAVFLLPVGLFTGALCGALMNWRFGLALGLGCCLIGAVCGGLHRKMVETKIKPNQGIYLTARNGLVTGLVLGIVGGMIAGMIFGVSYGVLFGFGYGGFCAFLYGGLDIGYHVTLRLLLYLKGDIPFNYGKFLDRAADLIFLQKVGGGYIFTHRLLLEHFSKMNHNIEQGGDVNGSD